MMLMMFASYATTSCATTAGSTRFARKFTLDNGPRSYMYRSYKALAIQHGVQIHPRAKIARVPHLLSMNDMMICVVGIGYELGMKL